MPAKPSGKVKTDTIHVRQKNGDIYIYERQSIYDPEKKYNRTLSSRLVSKIPKGEEVPVPTRPKRRKSEKKSSSADEQEKPTADSCAKASSEKSVEELLGESSLPAIETSAHIISASRNKVGMMNILDFIGRHSGIDEALYMSSDPGTAQKIISIARYLVGTNGSTLPGITAWQYSHRLPYEDGISEDVYHDLFEHVGRDETLQQRFFAARCAKLGERAVLAYDSTTISTYSKSLPEARQGFNKDHDGLDTIKLLTLYSIDTRQPVAFTRQPGNLPDVTSIRTALSQLEVLGVHKAEIVTDNGYYSEGNLSEMLQAHFDFITLVKTSIKWVSPELDKLIDEDAFRSIRSYLPEDLETRGITVTLKHAFTRERRYSSNSKGLQKGDKETFTRRIYLHLYFNPLRRAEYDVAMDRDLMELKTEIENGTSVEELSESARNKVNRYFSLRTRGGKTTVTFLNDEIDKARRYHGFFALVSNCEKNASECLAKYRKRETIEFFFKEDKEKTDGARPRVRGSDTLRGRMFTQFVTMCYYEYLNERIRQVRKKLAENIQAGQCSKQLLGKLKKLQTWLNETPVYLILQWFDTVEEVDISSKLKRKRWNTEITERDAMFLIYFWCV